MSELEGNLQEVDIGNLKSDADLKMLKKQDAFLYYSIPAVKKAEFLNQKINVSKLHSVTGMRRNSNSCPGRMMTQGKHARRSIPRSTRILFECHDNLKLEQFSELTKFYEEDSVGVVGDENEKINDHYDNDNEDIMLKVFTSLNV